MEPQHLATPKTYFATLALLTMERKYVWDEDDVAPTFPTFSSYVALGRMTVL